MAIFSDDHPFTFGDLSYPSGGQYGPMSCVNLSISVLHYGEIYMTLDGITQRFSGKVAFLSLSKNTYTAKYTAGKKSRCMWCDTFDFQPSSELIQHVKKAPSSLPPSKRLMSLIDMGVELDQDKGLKTSRIRSLLGKLCFEEYFHMANLHEEHVPIPESVLRAKRHIQMHYADDCSVERLAEISDLTGRHLIRLFHKHFNYSPSHYVWQLRLKNSAQLLCHSGLAIGEIAFKCGFQSQAHFSRAIKKRYGFSPSDLRKRSWYRDLDVLGQAVAHEIYE